MSIFKRFKNNKKLEESPRCACEKMSDVEIIECSEGVPVTELYREIIDLEYKDISILDENSTSTITIEDSDYDYISLRCFDAVTNSEFYLTRFLNEIICKEACITCKCCLGYPDWVIQTIKKHINRCLDNHREEVELQKKQEVADSICKGRTNEKRKNVWILN